MILCGWSASAPSRFFRSSSYSVKFPSKNATLLALEGENMRGDPVQEPPVVADHHGAAREVFQALFKRPHGVHVDVVRGLVEKQHVRLFLQYPREVHPVPFAAREDAHLLLLVRASEVEP